VRARGCWGRQRLSWRFEVNADSQIRALQTAHDFPDDAWASCEVLPRPKGLMRFDVVAGDERCELLTDEEHSLSAGRP
jgi:hypothetical protein